MNVKLTTFLLVLLLNLCGVFSVKSIEELWNEAKKYTITTTFYCVMGQGKSAYTIATIRSDSENVNEKLEFIKESAGLTNKEIAIFFLGFNQVHGIHGYLGIHLEFNNNWYKASGNKGIICFAKTIAKSGFFAEQPSSPQPFETQNRELSKRVIERAAKFVNEVVGNSGVRAAGIYTGSIFAAEFLAQLEDIRGRKAESLVAFFPPNVRIPKRDNYINPTFAKRVQVFRDTWKKIDSTGHLNIFVDLCWGNSYFRNTDIFRVTTDKTFAFYASPILPKQKLYNFLTKEGSMTGGYFKYDDRKSYKGTIPSGSYLIGMHSDFAPPENSLDLQVSLDNEAMELLAQYTVRRPYV